MGQLLQGQANMARLENEYIKEHTLLPGEWYGGIVAIEPPVSDGDAGRKTIAFALKLELKCIRSTWCKSRTRFEMQHSQSL